MYSNPIANSATPFERDLTRLSVTEMTFQTIADGGFGGGTLGITPVTDAFIEEALTSWQMKTVIFTDAGGAIAYKGYIAEINAVTEHHDYTWSIDPFFNQANVLYQSAGAGCSSGASCTMRQQVNETDVDSTYASQSALGIKEQWIDMSNGSADYTTSANATRKGKQELSKILKPLSTQLNLGKGSEPQKNGLHLTLWGAFSTLTFRKTILSANNATEIKTLITRVLQENPNKVQYLDVSDLSLMVTTGQTLPYNTGAQWMTVQDYITGTYADGDSSGKRLFFQIDEQNRPVLYARSTAPVYYSTRGEWRIFNSDKGTIPPHLVRAGGYVQADDFTVGIDEPSDVIKRGRASLIEQTDFDAMTDTLTIAPPSTLLDTKRLHARMYKEVRGRKYSIGLK